MALRVGTCRKVIPMSSLTSLIPQLVQIPTHGRILPLRSNGRFLVSPHYDLSKERESRKEHDDDDDDDDETLVTLKAGISLYSFNSERNNQEKLSLFAGNFEIHLIDSQ